MSDLYTTKDPLCAREYANWALTGDSFKEPTLDEFRKVRDRIEQAIVQYHRRRSELVDLSLLPNQHRAQ